MAVSPRGAEIDFLYGFARHHRAQVDAEQGPAAARPRAAIPDTADVILLKLDLKGGSCSSIVRLLFWMDPDELLGRDWFRRAFRSGCEELEVRRRRLLGEICPSPNPTPGPVRNASSVASGFSAMTKDT
jgi:hypothetical protein